MLELIELEPETKDQDFKDPFLHVYCIKCNPGADKHYVAFCGTDLSTAVNDKGPATDNPNNCAMCMDIVKTHPKCSGHCGRVA